MPSVDHPRADLERDLQLARRAHRRLCRVLEDALAAGRFDAAGPSRLPGWNRAQLVTHLARNADSHRRMIEGAADGEVLDQYVGGADGRNADIAAGRDRSSAAVVADHADAASALEVAWSHSDWAGEGRRTLAGRATPIVELPFLRAREVELHGVDLDIGLGLEDLDQIYVDVEIDVLTATWRRRRSTDADLPTSVVNLEPHLRVGWLTGRVPVDGVEPAGIF